MLLLFRIAYLASLIRLSTKFDPLRDRPGFMAIVYSLGCFALNMAGGAVLYWAGIGFAVTVVLAWFFFWLLASIEESLGNWLITMLIGIPLLIFGDRIAYQILRTWFEF